jgi:hypothetical protein
VCTYSIAHQTLLTIHRTRVLLLKIGIAAFTPTHGREVEGDGSDASFRS